MKRPYIILMCIAFILGGCELITAVDRDKINENTGGVGATGGNGGTGNVGGTGGSMQATGGSGGQGGTTVTTGGGGTGGMLVGGAGGTGGGTGGSGGNCNEPEVCDGIDNNCVDGIDEGDTCTPTINFGMESDFLHKGYLLDPALMLVPAASSPDNNGCSNPDAFGGTVGVNYRYLYWDNDGTIEFEGKNLKDVEIGWLCSSIGVSPCADFNTLSAEYSGGSFTPVTPTVVGDGFTNTYTVSVPAGGCSPGTVTLYIRVLSVLP